MTPSEILARDGVYYVDAKDGMTLELITMLIPSDVYPIRLDDIIVSPVLINGKLVLKLELSARLRHARDEDVLWLGTK